SDIAVRISKNDLTRRAEDGLRVLLDRRLVLFRVRCALTLVELGHRILNDLRVRDEVVAQDALHFALLAGGQFIGIRNLWDSYRKKRRADGGYQVRSDCHWTFVLISFLRLRST